MTTNIAPLEHAPSCRQPGMHWQAVILDHLPRRGTCPECGAVEIWRSSAPPPTTTVQDRRRERRRHDREEQENAPTN